MKKCLNNAIYFLVICLFIANNALSGIKLEKLQLTNRVTNSNTVVFQWTPFLEWSINNTTFSGNPYDLEANVTFEHVQSGETKSTGMYYSEVNTWSFRFTGTKVGEWEFSTSSSDEDLNGHKGVIYVEANPDPEAAGFVTNFGNKWGRSGKNKAFIPQFVMYDNPAEYYNNPDKIDGDIQTFIMEHGFTGFHTMVGCRWFDLNKSASSDILITNPDPRTFEALELLILKTHQAGGVVHIWAWGDDHREMTPTRWGLNSAEDKRIQRYIAARLGPLPGWTMSYGFDLHEWAKDSDLKIWHEYMHQQLGWFHFLGGQKSWASKSDPFLTGEDEHLDYASYEQNKPSYQHYLNIISEQPEKPSFMEARFRIRGIAEKDYSMEETRRGLWRSALAGGVANIWGNLVKESTKELIDGNLYCSEPYPKPEWIKTYSEFFDSRFLKNMIVDTNITDGMCLKDTPSSSYIFYKEETDFLTLNLPYNLKLPKVICIDTKLPYGEIPLDELKQGYQIWQAPYQSDWAIAIGNFILQNKEINSKSKLEEIPNEVKVCFNYPNPFNAETKISFYSPKQCSYTFSIFDLNGRLVKQIKEYGVKNGFNNIHWDGKNQFGTDVPSGIYIFTLKSGNFNTTKKMIKLK